MVTIRRRFGRTTLGRTFLASSLSHGYYEKLRKARQKAQLRMSERLLAGADREGAVTSNATRLLKRLGPADLIFYGVGSTVGAGIYSWLERSR